MQTPEISIEHHPSCKERCVPGCRVSPGRAIDVLSVHSAEAIRHPSRHGRTAPPGTVVGRRIRPIAGGSDRFAPPLWERVDDWACLETLRDYGVPTPQPDVYPERVADDHYNLDRWTRPEGIADRELDATHAAMGDVRKSRARAAPDVGDLATMLREAFPAVAAIKAPQKPQRAMLQRAPRPSRGFASTADLYEAITGEKAPRPRRDVTAEDWTAVIGQGGIYVGLVWGLALWLFGRESDPLPEHAIGRMLPGVPVREMRAPFSSPTAALFTADHDLPMLGGGAMSLEIAMPKKRTWSKPDEMKVHSTHGGTAHIRGEQSVNRCLSARGAVARAGLAPHEVAAAQVLANKDMMHEERVTALREIHARANGVNVDNLTTGATAQAAAVWRYCEAPREAEREAIGVAQKAGEDVKERLAKWEQGAADFASRLSELAGEDRKARPRLVREATADVSDGQLLAAAKGASRRLAVAVRRVTRIHDPLVPAATRKAPVRWDDVGEVRPDMAAVPAGLAL